MPLLTWLKARAASVVLGHLFLSLPELQLDEAKERAFERVSESVVGNGGGALVDYRCDYSKADFLRYLVSRKDVLLHGSNRAEIDSWLRYRQRQLRLVPWGVG